jgi:hypothetical protein
VLEEALTSGRAGGLRGRIRELEGRA